MTGSAPGGVAGAGDDGEGPENVEVAEEPYGIHAISGKGTAIEKAERRRWDEIGGNNDGERHVPDREARPHAHPRFVREKHNDTNDGKNLAGGDEWQS